MHIIGNDNDLCIKRMLDNAYKQLENSIENQCYMNGLNQRKLQYDHIVPQTIPVS